MGAAFDGIVDSINGYWTHEQLTALGDYLLMHAHNYLPAPGGPPLSLVLNRSVQEEVSRLLADNALAFLLKYLTANT